MNDQPTPCPATSTHGGAPSAPVDADPEVFAATADASDQQILQLVADYYAGCLNNEAALAFLEKRGLNQPEAIAHFRLGFSDRSLGLRLPGGAAGAHLRGRLTQLGVLRSTGHELLRGSLIVPVLDETGNVVQMFGRKVGTQLRKGTPLEVWLPGSKSALWNIEALTGAESIILCQEPLDGLTCWVNGFRNAVSTSGLDAPIDNLAVFKARGIERVFIAFENTDTGNLKATEVTEVLTAQGLECRRVLLPEGHSVSSYLRKVKVPSSALPDLFTSAGVTTSTKAVAAPVVPPAPARVDRPAVLSLVKAPKPSKPEVLPPPQPSPSPAEDELVITLGDRRYRARGISRNTTFAVLKVNLLASRTTSTGATFHSDTFDLLVARQRVAFVKAASIELGVKEDVIRKDLGQVLLRLEEEQEKLIRETLEPKPPAYTMTEAESAAALALLRSPNLVDQMQTDFERCGLVGEGTNALLGCLAVTSRKLDKPLALLIRSSSAAGKSALMEALLDFTPEEERVKFSSMTAQSLFYIGVDGLKHKVLAVAEDEGAARIAYPLKLLLSDGELSIASTSKDATGKLVAETYSVRGPISLLLTSTAADIDEELANRCLTVTVNEEPAQTRAIHQLQRERETLEGLFAKKERDAIRNLHRNAQRLLRPLAVLNPFAHELRFPDSQTRLRRDFLKYLGVIKSIALLHQHQREVKTANVGGDAIEYIEVAASDIALANQLCREVLGLSLDDLAPQARRLLHLLDKMASEACALQEVERGDFRFSRRDVRLFSGWSDFQVRVHLKRLLDFELVVAHRGGRGQLFEYELLWDGRADDGGCLGGFLGAQHPKPASSTPSSPTSGGDEGKFEPPVSPLRAPTEPPVRAAGNGGLPSSGAGFPGSAPSEGENARPGHINSPPSYSYPRTAADITSALTAATEER